MSIPPLAAADASLVRFGLATLVLGVYISIGCWVYLDATARGSSLAVPWGVAAGVVPFAELYYLARRSAIGPNPSPSNGQRMAATFAWAWVLTFVVGATVSPPNPFSMVQNALTGLVVTLPASYLLVYRGGYRKLRRSVANWSV